MMNADGTEVFALAAKRVVGTHWYEIVFPKTQTPEEKAFSKIVDEFLNSPVQPK